MLLVYVFFLLTTATHKERKKERKKERRRKNNNFERTGAGQKIIIYCSHEDYLYKPIQQRKKVLKE